MPKIMTRERKTTAVLGATAASREKLRTAGALHHEEIAREHEIERLIDDCRAQLDANAWLPKAYQRKLFSALVETRTTLSRTLIDLSKEIVLIRGKYKSAYQSWVDACERERKALGLLGAARIKKGSR